MCYYAWTTQAIFITLTSKAKLMAKFPSKEEPEAETVTKLSSGQTCLREPTHGLAPQDLCSKIHRNT